MVATIEGGENEAGVWVWVWVWVWAPLGAMESGTHTRPARPPCLARRDNGVREVEGWVVTGVRSPFSASAPEGVRRDRGSSVTGAEGLSA